MGNSPNVAGGDKSGTLTLGLNGTSFDAKNPSDFGLSAPNMDLTDLGGKEFRGFMSDYVLNSLAAASFSTGSTLDVSSMLGFLNMSITTD